MVRVKNRYILVNILYPDIDPSQSISKVPDLVAFNQPTTDALTPQVLLRAIRTEVSDLFGDYGAGAVAGSLASMFKHFYFIWCKLTCLQVKYLSPATSTFILRVSRAHYRLAWAALSFMNRVPVKDGKNCVFRVVRVSGTIRKAEADAIRRARDMIIRARRDLGEKSDATLDSIFGKPKGPALTTDVDLLMVDRGTSDEGEDYSDG
jgi:ribonuclease P/MRP protein subunit POP5